MKKKFIYKFVKRHELAEIGFDNMKNNVKFKYSTPNVAEDLQVEMGIQYLGSMEGWELVSIDKPESNPSTGHPYGLDIFIFKKEAK